MKLESLIWAACLLPAICAVSPNIIQANDKNFKQLVTESDKYSFVDFYADWCRHCLKLAPTIDKIADLFADEDSVQIIKVNGDKDGKSLVKKFDIPGFPMLKMFHGKDIPVDFDGMRNEQAISNFIQQVSGVRLNQKAKLPEIKMKSSKLVELYDLNFQEKVLQADKPTLVVVSREDHNEMEKKFDVLANQIFANDGEKFQFGIININNEEEGKSSENILESFGVFRVPIVLYFDPNQIPEDGLRRPELYEGKLNLDSLVDFVNEKGRLHRDIHGNLNDKAGRIEKFDEIIGDRLKGASNEQIAEVLRELQELNSVLNDKSNRYSLVSEINDFSMTNYYFKLINKIILQEEQFFKLEYNRLDKILNGNSKNLKPTTVDNMKKRINILNVFLK